jgi:hypothetical protein
VTTVTAVVDYKKTATPAAFDDISLTLQFPSANGKLDSTPIVKHILASAFSVCLWSRDVMILAPAFFRSQNQVSSQI